MKRKAKSEKADKYGKWAGNTKKKDWLGLQWYKGRIVPNMLLNQSKLRNEKDIHDISLQFWMSIIYNN